MTVRTVPRYRGMVAAGILLVIGGSIYGDPWIVSLAAVPVLFVVYGALSGAPAPDLEVERSIDPDRPLPGNRSTVRLAVHNRSDAVLPDVRVADGVPPDLAVADGSPEAAVALRPGESATVEYELHARRGEYEFDDPTVRLRGAAGTAYRDLHPEASGDDRLAGRVFLEEPPTRRETATLVGAVPTDAGGSGVEFHTTREYQPGDPVNRIDWRQLARTGDLSTVNYREHRGVATVVLADCREVADPASDGEEGTDLCRYAADRMVHALSAAGQDVGVAVLHDTDRPWIPPGQSDVIGVGRTALRSPDERGEWSGTEFLLDDEFDGDVLARSLAEQLPAGGQVVLVSPLGDDLPIEASRLLDAYGHAVTVVTPDLGEVSDPAGRLAAVDRRTRIDWLRDADARVVNWPREDPLPLAVEETVARVPE